MAPFKICGSCTDILEDEANVTLSCTLYDDFRKMKQSILIVDFMSFDGVQKMVFLITDINMIRSCANFLKAFYLIQIDVDILYTVNTELT